MIAAAPLVQEPAPTIVGERVNSQGSRKAKELLLADDYDGLLQVAEDQVEGGAHVLDLCVALTERQDEDEQMRRVAKKVSLTQPSPIQVDSTEPDVIATALDQIPGRAIVNSVNLEAGEDKLNTVVPIAMAHGAALIALTIDEVGMAKTRERKLEVAKRIVDLVCDQHGMDPRAADLRRADLHADHRRRGVEAVRGRDDRGHPADQVRAARREDLARRLQRLLRHRRAGAQRPELGLPAPLRRGRAGPRDGQPEPHHALRRDPEAERKLADDLVFNRRDDALEIFIQHFEAKGPEAEAEAADPTAGMEPEEALHWHILRRKREGVEAQIDACVEKIGAVPTLNTVLLPAMKEVGDKFGAGELILPFVLQSAEVMKRAVAQLEQYLDKLEGYTKGTVVLATVFGDVHDIGKSLVNTILTNNGYTVVDLGKQVPISTILDAAKEHKATAIGLSALLVSTSKQMPLAVQELHSQNLEFPVLLGGAAINRKFALRALYPEGKESDVQYDPGVFYCKDAFEGLAVMDRLIEPEHRAALVEEIRAAGTRLREVGEEEEVLDTTDDTVRSAVRTDVEVPEPPFWGVREIEVDREELYTHLDTHVLFKLHWGGRGVKGEEWRKLLDEDFRPRLERMWAAADYLHPRALLGYFPCYSEGNDIVVLDPEDRETVIERFTCPRQPKGDRLCLADFYRPKDSGELDVVALQAVTVGSEVTELMAKLEEEGEFAEQLFVHGLGVQTAEGLAEWLHWRVRNDLGIDVRQGRRYAWGYPAVPDQSEHLKVERLLEPLADRDGDLRRLRADPGAVDARADRPPLPGRLLRHAQRPPAARRLARRRDPRHRARPLALRRDRPRSARRGRGTRKLSAREGARDRRRRHPRPDPRARAGRDRGPHGPADRDDGRPDRRHLDRRDHRLRPHPPRSAVGRARSRPSTRSTGRRSSTVGGQDHPLGQRLPGRALRLRRPGRLAGAAPRRDAAGRGHDARPDHGRTTCRRARRCCCARTPTT